MDSSRYFIGEKYSNNSDGKKYDADAGGTATSANIEVGRRNIKASDLKALKVLFDVDYTAFFRE